MAIVNKKLKYRAGIGAVKRDDRLITSDKDKAGVKKYKCHCNITTKNPSKAFWFHGTHKLKKK